MAKQSTHRSNKEEHVGIVIAVFAIPALFVYSWLESHHPAWHLLVVILIHLFMFTFCCVGAWLFWRLVFATLRSPANQFTHTIGGKVSVGLRCIWPLISAVGCSVGMLGIIIEALRFVSKSI